MGNIRKNSLILLSILLLSDNIKANEQAEGIRTFPFIASVLYIAYKTVDYQETLMPINHVQLLLSLGIISETLSFKIDWESPKKIQFPVSPLNEFENKYIQDILIRYKLNNPDIRLLKTNDSKASYAQVIYPNIIVLNSELIKNLSENNPQTAFFIEFAILHELGHLHEPIKNNLINITKFMIKYMFISNIFFKIIFSKKENFSVPAYMGVLLTNLLTYIILLSKNYKTCIENFADKFAFEKLAYQNPEDYVLLTSGYILRKQDFHKKLPFLTKLTDTHYIKRLFWYFYDKYIFPQDAIEILKYKLLNEFKKSRNLSKDVKDFDEKDCEEFNEYVEKLSKMANSNLQKSNTF